MWSWERGRRIHGKMETELGKGGAFLDGIYVCPHHKDKGFEGSLFRVKGSRFKSIELAITTGIFRMGNDC